MTLWLIDSKFRENSDLLKSVVHDDIVVLRGDAVYSAMKLESVLQAKVMALGPDCQMRGIDFKTEQLVSMETILELTAQASQIVRL